MCDDEMARREDDEWNDHPDADTSARFDEEPTNDGEVGAAEGSDSSGS